MRLLRTVAVCAALMACAQKAHAAAMDVAWWRDGKLSAVRLDDKGGQQQGAFDGSRMVPLGSLWKLFVYVYAVDGKVATPDYTCTGRQPKEEVYCCEPGNSIARDDALAQSCGLFFSPLRLMLDRAAWRQYWDGRLGRAPSGETAWLADPALLGPGRLVTLRSLMAALASLPAESRSAPEAALLRVVLGARGASTVGYFGGQLRVKTFSWHAPGRPSERLGGAAGWLADGTPVWFSAPGTSTGVMQKWGPRLAAALPPPMVAGDAGCVIVDYFARYPIRRVDTQGAAAKPGVLNGRYQVSFENGRSLAFTSQGEMVLGRDAAGKPQLSGRLGLNDYVARVIDREGGTAQPEAAKALAIAARTYLQQNAVRFEGCQRIADSSATQRVSPNPATAPARAIAHWTGQLVLAGSDVRYHGTRASKDTMSWSGALDQARGGKRFDEILATAYPSAELTIQGGGPLQCTRLPAAQAWLARELPLWERVLRKQEGYERPGELPAVCRLAGGAPYSEQARNRVFVRGLSTREDRITLAHEFIHLGLRNHPRGQDEELVEQLARRLVDLRLEASRQSP